MLGREHQGDLDREALRRRWAAAARAPRPTVERVGCVNTISLQIGHFRTADEFTHPTGRCRGGPACRPRNATSLADGRLR